MISVIVPVYNRKETLERCVQSLRGQTYPDLEIILVDDGSTDGSGALCNALAREDVRIRVIHKENGGVSSARNAGIEAAKGEYLMFTDSDDYAEAQMAEKLLEGSVGEMIVTPREVDNLVADAAQIVATGINRALHPGLSVQEIREMMD